MSEEFQGANAPEVAEPVTQEPVEQATPSVNEPEVAAPVEKPVQDAQTNARFADIRRRAEQEARDNVIKELYGEQGITSYDQYQQAKADYEQQQRDNQLRQQGIDPDLINQLLEHHPDIQWAREMQSKQAEENKFQAEANEFFDMFKDVDPATIQPEVWRLKADKGLSLVDAYMRVNWGKQVTQGEQQAVQKLMQNAQSSPGALSQGGNVQDTSISKMSKADFQKLQDQVLRGERRTL